MGKWFGKDPSRVVVAALIVIALAAWGTVAMAQTNPAEKCALFGDLALTTRAMVVEGVPDEQVARVLTQMYTATPRFIEAMLKAAHSAKGMPPSVFSRSMFGGCMQAHQ